MSPSRRPWPSIPGSRWRGLESRTPSSPIEATVDLGGDRAARRKRARMAAERAVELAPGLADAYLARADVQLWLENDWRGQRADLERARALAPGDPAVALSYGFYHQAQGDLDQAIAEFERALAIEPARGAGVAERVACPWHGPVLARRPRPRRARRSDGPWTSSPDTRSRGGAWAWTTSQRASRRNALAESGRCKMNAGLPRGFERPSPTTTSAASRKPGPHSTLHRRTTAELGPTRLPRSTRGAGKPTRPSPGSSGPASSATPRCSG